MEYITNPLTKEKVKQNSEEGRDIIYLNSICNKCDNSKIYDIKSNRCILRSKVKRGTLLEQIQYCNAYELDKSIENDNTIINNILNIKIPKDILANKSIKIKELVGSNFRRFKFTHIDIASKLNVRNSKVKKIINKSLLVAFTLFNIALANETSRIFIFTVISGIFSLTKGNLTLLLFKMISLFKTSSSLFPLLRILSFKKLWIYLTGLFTIFSNIPSSKLTQNNVKNIGNFTLTGTFLPVNNKVLESSNHRYKRLNHLYPSDVDILVSKIPDAFNENTQELNLHKIGVNTDDIYKEEVIHFDYDYSEKLPILLTQQKGTMFNQQPSIKRIKIYPKEERKSILSKVKKDIGNLISDVESEKKNVEDYLSLQQDANELRKINDKITNLNRKISLEEKTSVKISLRHQKSELKRKSEKLSEKLKNIPEASIEKINNSVNVKKDLVNLEAILKDFNKNELKKVNEDNINSELPILVQFMNDSINAFKGIKEHSLDVKSKTISYSRNTAKELSNMAQTKFKKTIDNNVSRIIEPSSNQSNQSIQNLISEAIPIGSKKTDDTIENLNAIKFS